jgi:hypothetical protein
MSRTPRILGVLTIMLLVFARATSPVTAQEPQTDPAFSQEILGTLGLPEIQIVQQADGFDVPQDVAAGRYLVALVSQPEYSAYVNLVQVPDGLSQVEAEEQLLSAARFDVPVPGWTYGGGTFAFGGNTAWVVLDLKPGEWTWALTSQPDDSDEETVSLVPLTVTAGTPSASAPTATIEPTVDVEMTEYVFQGLNGVTIPAGPQVWRFSNVGDHAHHMVLYRTPTLITQADVLAMVDAFMSVTPTPPPSWWMESVWVGYAAIMSPGQTMLTEYKLSPGSYVALCFVADPETGMPHLAEGMAQSFTVE